MSNAVSLNSSTFTHLLKTAVSPSNGRKGHLCKHTTQPLYQVFPASKSNPTITQQGFRPLILRDIISLSIHLKTELKANPELSHNMAATLLEMSQAKNLKEKKRCCLIRFIRQIYDCLANFFKGLGFHTSATLARELAREFARVPNLVPPLQTPPQDQLQTSTTTPSSNLAPSTNTPTPIPIQTLSPDPSPRPSPRQLKSPNEDETKGRVKRALHHYDSEPIPQTSPSASLYVNTRQALTSPNIRIDAERTWEKGLESRQVSGVNLPKNKYKPYLAHIKKAASASVNQQLDARTSSIFIDVKNIKELPNGVAQPSSLFGLIRSISGVELYDGQNSYADLSDSTSLQVLRDYIEYCNLPAALDHLSEELKQYKTFSPQALIACLQAFDARRQRDFSKKQIGTFVRELLKFYKEKRWDLFHDIDHAIIIHSMGLVLGECHNDEATKLLLEWFIDHPSFSYSICTSWIQAYLDYGRFLSTQCPNLDLVTSQLEIREGWKVRLKQENLYLYELLFNQTKTTSISQPVRHNTRAETREAARKASQDIKNRTNNVNIFIQVTLEESIIFQGKKNEFLQYLTYIDKKIKRERANLSDAVKSKILTLGLAANPTLNNPNDSINSLEGLIKAVARCTIQTNTPPHTRYVDLDDIKTQQVIQDAICFHDTIIHSLWDWLKNNPSFNGTTIKLCLQACLSYAESNNTKKIKLLLFNCLKEYKQEFKHHHKHLPLNDSILIDSLVYQLIMASGEHFTSELLEWYVNSDSFRYEDCLAILKAYLAKHNHALNFTNPSLKSLCDKVKGNSGWMKKLKQDHSELYRCFNEQLVVVNQDSK